MDEGSPADTSAARACKYPATADTHAINVSFVGRLRTLSDSFDSVNEDRNSLEIIEDVHGKDEIGSLMRNYNRMVIRLKDLIKTVYEDRLEKQEIDIARQQAELLALHSQINPHFLFNVLESIRMHSLIKHEDETAREAGHSSASEC